MKGHIFGPDLLRNRGVSGAVFDESCFAVEVADADGDCINFEGTTNRERSARRPRFLRWFFLRRLAGFMKREITRLNDGMKPGVSSGGRLRLRH